MQHKKHIILYLASISLSLSLPPSSYALSIVGNPRIETDSSQARISWEVDAPSPTFLFFKKERESTSTEAFKNCKDETALKPCKELTDLESGTLYSFAIQTSTSSHASSSPLFKGSFRTASSSPSQEPTEPSSEQKVISIAQKGNLLGTVEITIQADKTNEVFLYMLGLDATVSLPLGSAIRSQTSPSRWIYIFNTLRFPDGRYKLYARLGSPDETRITEPVEIIVANSITPTTQSATSTQSTLRDITKTSTTTSSSTPGKKISPTASAHDNNISPAEKLIEERSSLADMKDSDKDGLIDFDEMHIYMTDPKIADSDKDGINDTEEILSYTQVQDARTNKSLISSELTLTKLTSKPNQQNSDIESITFSGTSFPHSIVTLLIYSDPLIKTVQADENGDWQYTLSDKLPDGEHTLYVALSDTQGNILVKSDPMVFTKQKNKVVVGPIVPEENAPKEIPDFYRSNAFYSIVGIVMLGIIVALFLFGQKQKKKAQGPISNNPIIWK